MSGKLEMFEIPTNLKTPGERAAYCREHAMGLVKRANAASDEATKFELFNCAERWMTLAFQCRRETP